MTLKSEIFGKVFNTGKKAGQLTNSGLFDDVDKLIDISIQKSKERVLKILDDNKLCDECELRTELRQKIESELKNK